MGTVGPSEIESPEERRKAARAVTFRSSSFTELTGEPRRCQGKVVDVSPSGFQLKSRMHVPVGSVIELEIAPRDDEADGQTLVACAKVVWTNPLSTGEIAMGLKNIPSDVLDSMGVKSYFSTPMQSNTEAEPDGHAALPQSDLDYVQFREAAHERLKRRRPVWPYLLALFMLLMMLWFLFQGPGVVSSVSPDGAAPFMHALETDGVPQVSTEAMGGPATSIDGTTLPKWLSRGHDLMAIGHMEEAIALFSALLDSGIATGSSAGLALAGLAAALEASGRPGEAAAALTRGRAALDGEMPEAWNKALDTMRGRTAMGIGSILLPALALDAAEMDNGLEEIASPFSHGERMSAPYSDAGAAAPGQAEIRLEVSLSEHVLRVRQGDELLAAFPIGTGGFERTPQGVFRIVNRITHPAWYNKGVVVPAGDPENPLGSRWMGLGTEEGAIPYGIHGAPDPLSIGGSGSAGCLRMYPADVERLFEWCKVGDVVQIS